MLLRGFFTIAGICITVIAGAGLVMGSSVITPPAKDAGLAGAPSTLALAPISLGNPTAASAALETAVPRQPDDPADAAPLTAPPVRRTVTAGRGDTLAGLLRKAGVAADETHAAVVALSKHFNPKRFRRGQEISIDFKPHGAEASARRADAGDFAGFSLAPDHEHEIRVARTEDGKFKAQVFDKVLIRTPARVEGRIESSLYLAGKKSGLPDTTLIELIRAYSWDVDFQRDIRRGDSFEVLYERVENEAGDLVKATNIRFASLTLSGKRHAIYRFLDDKGHTNYYDEKGRSARKALMRTPIDGARLSSRYGRRKHTILGYTKMHRGVDFAAPRGTPIYAAGNGIIERAGRNGSYGNYIRIRHNSTYSTAYAHLKGFARGARQGRRVSQGQVIGYVGTTGRSTGPHLHYEIIRNGRQTNPLRVKMPSGRKLNGQELARFQKIRHRADREFAALKVYRKAERSSR